MFTVEVNGNRVDPDEMKAIYSNNELETMYADGQLKCYTNGVEITYQYVLDKILDMMDQLIPALKYFIESMNEFTAAMYESWERIAESIVLESTVTLKAYCGYYVSPMMPSGTESKECQWEDAIVANSNDFLEGLISYTCPRCGNVLYQTDDHFELEE